MIALAFLVAAASHCADPNFCPTRDELKAAVDDRINRELIDSMSTFNAANPGQILLATKRRVLSVSNVYCGEPFEGPPKSVTCKLTFRYRRGKSYMIVQLERTRIWSVVDKLEVFEQDDVVREARLPL